MHRGKILVEWTAVTTSGGFPRKVGLIGAECELLSRLRVVMRPELAPAHLLGRILPGFSDGAITRNDGVLELDVRLLLKIR